MNRVAFVIDCIYPMTKICSCVHAESICKTYVLTGEATNPNLMVFDLTRLGLEPTIYHTQSEHVNLYTTDRCRLDTPFDTRSCFHISSYYLSTPFERASQIRERDG